MLDALHTTEAAHCARALPLTMLVITLVTRVCLLLFVVLCSQPMCTVIIPMRSSGQLPRAVQLRCCCQQGLHVLLQPRIQLGPCNWQLQR